MNTDTNLQQTPNPGPPKKGFWGFLASLFPKQPTPPDHVNPSSQSADPAEHISDEPSPSPQQQADAAQPQPVQQSEPQSASPASQTNGTTDILARPVPTIKPDHDPQPLAVPGNLEAAPIEADGSKVSPTLPTQAPGEGEPASETPQPIPPADPDRPVPPTIPRQ